MTDDLTKKRDDVCRPLAIELLKRLGAHDDLLIGSSAAESDEATIEFYGKFYQEEIIPLFLEKDITKDEAAYVFRLMQQAVAFAQGRSDITLDVVFERASERLWGCPMHELKLSKIEEVITKPVDGTVDKSLTDSDGNKVE